MKSGIIRIILLFSTILLVTCMTFTRKPFQFATKTLSAVVVATTISVSSFGLTDLPAAAEAPSITTVTTSASPINAFEKAVSSLEKAETRGDTLNSMADVFKVASGRSILAKSRYKKRIIEAINTKKVMLNNEWDQALSFAGGELKRGVDPFRTVDLAGYLSIAPFVGGGCYVGALAVQQLLPELFMFAYPGAVFVFVAPIIFIIIAT